MKQLNKDLRAKIATSGFHYWQIAEQIGISANTLCIWFRKELESDKKELILNAIEELKTENDL